MKILITNDDSISSSVLLPLMQWASRFGEVMTVVPKYEQSGKSHSIEIHKSFEVKKVHFAEGYDVYTVDSSPADCVRFAIEALHGDFDLIISGINKGLNIGIDIIYSGTVSAVMEAACYGIPAVALSTDPSSFDGALAALDGLRDFFLTHNLFKKNLTYNVNIPLQSKGIRITRMGKRYYSDDFRADENNLFMPMGKSVWEDDGDVTLDTNAVLTGYTSIMPLTLDRTNMKVFEGLLEELNKTE